MSDNYWLADREARVLGPVGLEVVRDLAVRGKLMDVRAVSRDGRTFVPVREVPEIVAVLSPPKADDLALAQAQATRQIRDWLDQVRDRPTQEILRVPQDASKDAVRAAFFTLVHRYVPSRLPAEATPELRLACEDAFLFLSERMVELEKKFRGGTGPHGYKSVPSPAPSAPRAFPTPAPSGPPPASPASPAAQVSWRGGMIHVRLELSRGDARPFTTDPDASWKSDSLFVASAEKPFVGGAAEVTIAFEGHVTELTSSGRVLVVRGAPTPGFIVKLLDLGEAQRSMIRTWVQKAR